MLCEEEIEMLEQVLGSDRLQKQLLNELLGSFVEDPNGITVETFDVFVELCSVINYTPNEGYGYKVSQPTNGRVFVSLNEINN